MAIRWKVEGGRLIRELSETKLDDVIARHEARVQELTSRIQQLRNKRTEIQLRLDEIKALKGELNT